MPIDALEQQIVVTHVAGISQVEVFAKSSETDIIYKFISKPTVAFDSVFLSSGEIAIAKPFDSSGPTVWLAGFSLGEPPYDSLCAPYYHADDDYGQIVRIGKQRYCLLSGSSLSDAQTKPINMSIGQTINGWCRLGDK